MWLQLGDESFHYHIIVGFSLDFASENAPTPDARQTTSALC